MQRSRFLQMLIWTLMMIVVSVGICWVSRQDKKASSRLLMLKPPSKAYRVVAVNEPRPRTDWQPLCFTIEGARGRYMLEVDLISGACELPDGPGVRQEVTSADRDAFLALMREAGVEVGEEVVAEAEALADVVRYRRGGSDLDASVARVGLFDVDDLILESPHSPPLSLLSEICAAVWLVGIVVLHFRLRARSPRSTSPTS